MTHEWESINIWGDNCGHETWLVAIAVHVCAGVGHGAVPLGVDSHHEAGHAAKRTHTQLHARFPAPTKKGTDPPGPPPGPGREIA